MANYSNLLAQIAANIYSNNNQDISGDGLQAQLNAMVASLGAGYQFMGVAHPADTPSGYADLRAFWLAGDAGTYTNFGGLVLADGEVAVIKYDGNGWGKDVTGAATAAQVAELSQEVIGIHYTVSDADVHQVDASSIIESPTGNRLRLIYPVKQGWNIMVVTKAEKGAAVSLYDTMERAVLSGSDYLQTFTNYIYKVSAYGIVSNDGYLSISLSKMDGSSISGSEKNALINGTTVLIYKDSIIEDKVGYSMDSQTITSLASKFRVVPNDYLYSENGTRLRIVLPIESGCLIKAFTTNETGIYVAIYSDIEEANVASRYPLQMISPEFGYSKTVEGVSSVSGFLSISFTNGTTPITDEIEAAMLESLFVSISSGLFKRVGVLEGKIDGADGGSSSELKELFLGTLLQKRVTASGLDDTNASRRVSMQSAIALPFDSVSLSFNLPDGYYVGIRHGNRAENLATNSYWFGNGETFTFPATSRYYRVCFGKNLVEGDCVDDVTPQEIQVLIDTGKISITYNESHNVIKDNTESEKYVKAMMREFFNDSSLNNSLPNIPVFAHMSDMHGDAKRFSQFLDYCDFLGVDAALISGDFAAYNPNNSCQYINDISDRHNTMVLPCTGNHDVRGLYTAKEQNEQVVGHLITKNNVVVNSLEGDYPTYFYKDFPEKNIRVISLNVHELTRSQTDGCNFTQTQANWFINTLANTPSSYGVLIMFHEPEVPTVKDEQNDAFYQPFGTILIYQDGITGSPISKIIDAFISKTTATITYTTQGTSVSVQPDFTNVANGVEFIAFVCGHEHLDWVGLVSNTTNRQLILDVTCGVALYGTDYPYLANISDLPRGGNGVTQDAFNIYGIDRVHKTVRVARVGSNITSEAKDRKCMIIPYAD